MLSLQQKLARIEGLTDTPDLSEWENEFVKGLIERLPSKGSVGHLTERQVSIIDQIHRKHFGG